MAYVSQKQLGNVLTITDAADGDIIGTPSDIAEARAIIFHQTTAGVTVTLAPPTPADVKLITIANRGFTSITVGDTVMNPGPAYGMFWDGTDFQPVAVDGVGTVDHVADSQTVAMLGDGTALNPLHANVKISALADNKLQIVNDGLYYPFTDIAPTSFWVDSHSGDDTAEGTLRAPFKTIAKAQAAITSGHVTPAFVFIYPGNYNESVNFAAVTETTYIGYGVRDGSGVNIIGSHSINSNLNTNARLRDLALKASIAGQSAFALIGYGGGFILENVSFDQADAETDVTVPVIDVQGGNTGVGILYNCEINGPIRILDGSSQSQIQLAVEGGSGAPDIAFTSTGSTLALSNRASVGTITHVGGKLYGKNIGKVKADANGNSLISTAGSTSRLVLQDVGFLQDDNTFGQIVKTGTAPWAFDIHGDPANDTFTGAQTLINSAKFVHADFVTPTNYTPLDVSVVGHFKGIDEKLGDVAGGLASVTSLDTPSVDMGGAGTVISPLTAAVKVSNAANNALSANNDGLFVAQVEAGGLDSVSHSNSAAISITGSGTSLDPLIADVFVSQVAHNLLSEQEDGLLVTEQPRTLTLSMVINFQWVAGEAIFSYTATEDFTIPAGFAGSVGRMSASPQVNQNLSVFLDTTGSDSTTSVGTIVITDNAITFATTGNADIAVAAGNNLRIVVPASAAFDYFNVSLFANRPFLT